MLSRKKVHRTAGARFGNQDTFIDLLSCKNMSSDPGKYRYSRVTFAQRCCDVPKAPGDGASGMVDGFDDLRGIVKAVEGGHQVNALTCGRICSTNSIAILIPSAAAFSFAFPIAGLPRLRSACGWPRGWKCRELHYAGRPRAGCLPAAGCQPTMGAAARVPGRTWSRKQAAADGSKIGWVRIKSAPAFSLRRRFLISCSGFSGRQVERAADEERGGLADIRPGSGRPRH